MAERTCRHVISNKRRSEEDPPIHNRSPIQGSSNGRTRRDPIVDDPSEDAEADRRSSLLSPSSVATDTGLQYIMTHEWSPDSSTTGDIQEWSLPFLEPKPVLDYPVNSIKA